MHVSVDSALTVFLQIYSSQIFLRWVIKVDKTDAYFFPEHIARPSDMEFSNGLLRAIDHNFVSLTLTKNSGRLVTYFSRFRAHKIFHIEILNVSLIKFY